MATLLWQITEVPLTRLLSNYFFKTQKGQPQPHRILETSSMRHVTCASAVQERKATLVPLINGIPPTLRESRSNGTPQLRTSVAKCLHDFTNVKRLNEVTENGFTEGGFDLWSWQLTRRSDLLIKEFLTSKTFLKNVLFLKWNKIEIT